MLSSSHVECIAIVVLWFLRLEVIANYTPECITGTTEVYMPSSEDGECYCGSSNIDPKGGYANAFCTPYPIDEGLGYGGCTFGDQEIGGPCSYFCTCLQAKRKQGKITCCTRRKDQGLLDGVVYVAPAPPPPITTYAEAWVMRTRTTLTTSTPPYYGAQKVLGRLELSTVIPWQSPVGTFLGDSQVQRGVAEGIAMKLDVPISWVSARLSIPEQYIEVYYEIDVPAETRGNTSAIALFMAILESDTDDGKHEWADTLALGMSKASEEDYKVAVHSVPLPSTVRVNRGRTTSHAVRLGGDVLSLQAWSYLMGVLLFVATHQTHLNP